MLLRHALGALLKRARHARGMTLRELSDAAAVSIAYLSELERGRKEASSEILAAICPVLDLSLADLFHAAATELSVVERGVVLDLRPVTSADAHAAASRAGSVAPAAPLSRPGAGEAGSPMLSAA